MKVKNRLPVRTIKIVIGAIIFFIVTFLVILASVKQNDKKIIQKSVSEIPSVTSPREFTYDGEVFICKERFIKLSLERMVEIEKEYPQTPIEELEKKLIELKNEPVNSSVEINDLRNLRIKSLSEKIYNQKERPYSVKTELDRFIESEHCHKVIKSSYICDENKKMTTYYTQIRDDMVLDLSDNREFTLENTFSVYGEKFSTNSGKLVLTIAENTANLVENNTNTFKNCIKD